MFVDLPGIKDDSKSGAEVTRSVVRAYVKNNPNDLYILVKKASDDPANWPWSLREFILAPSPKGKTPNSSFNCWAVRWGVSDCSESEELLLPKARFPQAWGCRRRRRWWWELGRRSFCATKKATFVRRRSCWSE